MFFVVAVARRDLDLTKGWRRFVGTRKLTPLRNAEPWFTRRCLASKSVGPIPVESDGTSGVAHATRTVETSM